MVTKIIEVTEQRRVLSLFLDTLPLFLKSLLSVYNMSLSTPSRCLLPSLPDRFMIPISNTIVIQMCKLGNLLLLLTQVIAVLFSDTPCFRKEHATSHFQHRRACVSACVIL